MTYFPDLSDYIEFDSKERSLDLTNIEKIVGDRANIEVYSNPYKLKVITTKAHRNIFTNEEI
jgi:hypothetical protein